MFAAVNLSAFELVEIFRHSEIAYKNSVFADVGLAPLEFKDASNFEVLPLDIRIEYVPPLPLPFSFGFFFQTPNPNLKSFGARLAYHFDLLDALTDFYVVYSFDFGYLRNDILKKYNDTPIEPRYYDFRIGVRRFFFSNIGIAVETGYKFQSVIFLLTVKIN